ncbi:hypothetical protein ILYODFUR_014867 [Ilyodon furcidens]|uniref:Uncharacterized protein n=1 Tax=Ilyodon furcidens TaxID=33524 RepID=A0ABV0TVV4_9TELE
MTKYEHALKTVHYSHKWRSAPANGNLTHPGGLHSFLPGGRSSRLFKGTTPIAACMIVMNFLNFIFYVSSNDIPQTNTGAVLSSLNVLSSPSESSDAQSPFLTASASPWQQASDPAHRSATSPCRGYYETHSRARL